jgi:hypothetical protein
MQGEGGGRDAQGQRQERARLRQLPGGRRLAGHPLLAEHAREERDGVVVAERLQWYGPGAVPGDQTAQPVPAGDQHQAPGLPGQ